MARWRLENDSGNGQKKTRFVQQNNTTTEKQTGKMQSTTSEGCIIHYREPQASGHVEVSQHQSLRLEYCKQKEEYLLWNNRKMYREVSFWKMRHRSPNRFLKTAHLLLLEECTNEKALLKERKGIGEHARRGR